MRIGSAVIVQPHLRKKLSAEKIIRFPWDPDVVSDAKRLSADERKKRREEIRKRLENHGG